MDKCKILNHLQKNFLIKNGKVYGNLLEIKKELECFGYVEEHFGHRGLEAIPDHTLSVEDDLFRRDLTINAIGINLKTKVLIDPYNGLEDLKFGIIKAVSPKSFSDDPLRMLRAIGFAARFNFKLHYKTKKEIIQNAEQIKMISPERIFTELEKIVQKGMIMKGAELLVKTKLYENIFGAKFNGNLTNFSKVNTMGEFVFMLLKDIEKEPSKVFKQALSGDNDTVREIKSLEYIFKEKYNKHWKNRFIAFQAVKIYRGILQSEIVSKPFLKAFDELKGWKYPSSLKELKVNGFDMLNVGYRDEEIGKKLNEIVIEIYQDKLKNNKVAILKYLKK